jgi:hypothetical protein
MFTLTRSVPINRPTDTVLVTREQVWKALTMKGRDGRPFVPPMTACAVLSGEDNNYVREIALNHGTPFRERVSVHSDKLIVFEHLDPPQTSVVLNQLEVDDQGEVCLRYTFLLEFDDLVHGSAEEAERKQALAGLPRAVDATLDTIHAMVERGEL